MSKTHEVTMEQVKPYLGSVFIKYDTRPNWGSPDGGWVDKAVELTGFRDFAVKSWAEGGEDNPTEWDCSVRNFLMDDRSVSDDGIWVEEDCGTEYIQIQDYANVRNRLNEVIRVAYVLADENLLLCERAVSRLAEKTFRDMAERQRNAKVMARYCIVRLTPLQWENVSRMKSPSKFKSNAYRTFAHDPWVVAEVDNAVVWDTKVWLWEGNRHWEVSGHCVFIKDGTEVNYKEDYPLDYWD